MAAKPSAARDDTLDARRIVAQIVPHLRIAHQLSGRVRFKLDAGALAAAPASDAGRLAALLNGMRGVRRVQLNLLARSCVVEYDATIIPDAAWPDLLAGRDTPAAAALVRIIDEFRVAPDETG